MIARYMEGLLRRHLAKYRQMVFLAGPRQVGKTTLAKGIITDLKPGVNYFNWDESSHRKLLLTEIFAGKADMAGDGREIVVFDEIHKYPRWKNSLKGLFDHNEPKTHWIVTGSAALNVYRRGQDSLLGRSFAYHLYPLSVPEIIGLPPPEASPVEALLEAEFAAPDSESIAAFEGLLNLGGFPEPFLKAEKSFLARWRKTRLERLVNQDLAKTEHIKNLPILENMMYLLPDKVGSPLSINSLREDLEVHHATAKLWTLLLDRVFYLFLIRPYSARISRGLKKEPKLYLWDWTEIDDSGLRFENMAAVHLMKWVSYVNDAGLSDLSLHYVRDKEKREVDFLICESKKPLILIECKLSDSSPHRALSDFARALGVKRAIQLTASDSIPKTVRVEGVPIEIVPAASFFRALV